MLIKQSQRPFSNIPKPIVIVFLVGLSLQTISHVLLLQDTVKVEKLKSPPKANILSIASLGEPEVLAKILMLWLQAFDNQPGISIPFSRLDYDKLESWLELIIKLDPKSNYALLAASRIYTEVPDPNKQKKMMELVYRHFLENPKKNWPWLAHITIVAKHRLKDYELALKYAHVLSDTKLSSDVPAWARQLEFIVLEDMGELETIRILAGGLIQNKLISDPKELRWLEQRLKQLENVENTLDGE